MRKFSLKCCFLLFLSILVFNIFLSVLNVVTARYKPNLSKLTSNDVLFTVRTSKITEATRLPGVIKTWFNFSPQTTFIVTNENRSTVFEYFGSKNYSENVIESGCRAVYSVKNLCCQSECEFSLYYQNEHQYKWFCRFDDDQYVNIPLLVEFLDQFDADRQMLYLGKPSWTRPKVRGPLRFWFATYGGGVCFSRTLLKSLKKFVYPKNQFVKSCVDNNDPDDIHVAFLLHKYLNVNLTVVKNFHHHLERNLFTEQVNASNIGEAITLGFKGKVQPQFRSLFQTDYFRIRTLHCLLYPDHLCLLQFRYFLNEMFLGTSVKSAS